MDSLAVFDYVDLQHQAVSVKPGTYNLVNSYPRKVMPVYADVSAELAIVVALCFVDCSGECCCFGLAVAGAACLGYTCLRASLACQPPPCKQDSVSAQHTQWSDKLPHCMSPKSAVPFPCPSASQILASLFPKFAVPSSCRSAIYLENGTGKRRPHPMLAYRLLTADRWVLRGLQAVAEVTPGSFTVAAYY
eukprot:1157938-Pelagomonas_calceolata.AAC.4